MTSQYRHRRTSVAATPFPSTLEPGEIAANTANRQLAIGDADGGTLGAPLSLLTIRFFDVRAQYAINDYVLHGGAVYRAKGPISPGVFNATNWDVAANPGTFVLRAGDTMTGHLSLPPTPAAANAVRKDYVDAADVVVTTQANTKVAKAGDTMTGFLTLHADPDAPMKAVTKQYVDGKPALTISDTPPPTPSDNAMWWDSDTGTLYVRYNDGVGAPQWVQATAVPAIDTSAFVLKSGSTMTGHLSLPTSPAAANAVRKDYVDAAAAAVPNANVLVNSDFRINQVGYVSAAVLAAGAYGHDQWKAGAAGGDYSFTQLKSSTQITIAAGKSLIQPIEDVNVVGGSYVLSWTGTAQARAGVNTLTPSGAYAASPLLIAGQTAGTVMSVEFNTGTLGTVKLEKGSTVTPFVMRPYDQESMTCRRYWEVCSVLGVGYSPGAGSGYFGQGVWSVQKRTIPALSGVNVAAFGFPTATGTLVAIENTAVTENRISNGAAPNCYYQSKITGDARL